MLKFASDITLTKPRLTIAEFETLLAHPENQNRLLELIDGEIHEKMPTQRHGLITWVLGGELYLYFSQHPQSGEAGHEVRHQMPDDEHNSLIPDLAVYLDLNQPIVDKGAVNRMPDIAVEVKSPDDTFVQMRAKAVYYLENGSRLVWLIYPEKQVVEVYYSPHETDLLTIDDTLEGGTVLPDFRVPLRKLFSR